MFARGIKTSRKLLASAIAVGATSALVATPATLAQETTAEVRGVVIDTSGAPLEGATIVVTSKATGISKTVEANANGGYSVRVAYLRVLFTTSKSGPMGSKIDDQRCFLSGRSVGGPQLQSICDGRSDRHWRTGCDGRYGCRT